MEMQFLADVKLLCEDCKGKRFKSEILEVKYKEKSMFDILDMSVESALIFFKDQLDVYNKLKPLFDVGLGYVKLGQPSSTLSGGRRSGSNWPVISPKRPDTSRSYLFLMSLLPDCIFMTSGNYWIHLMHL